MNNLFYNTKKQVEVRKNIIIDDEAYVLAGLQKASAIVVKDLASVIHYINTEQNTSFYIDTKMVCSMQPERDTIYLWLDTGLKTEQGKAIFISLLRKSDGVYIGNYTGTAAELKNSIVNYAPKNRKVINENFARFLSKYEKKTQGRTHTQIENEEAYLLEKVNGTAQSGVFASLFATMEEDLRALPEGEDLTVTEETEEVVSKEEAELEDLQKEITIPMLLEQHEQVLAYVDELLAKIEELSKETSKRDDDIEALTQKNQEYKRAMVQMRDFYQTEQKAQANSLLELQEAMGTNIVSMTHALLQRKTILILGGNQLNENVMYALAEEQGFEKKDLVIVSDYQKIKQYADRLETMSGHYAVVIGATPHKVKNLGDYSSLVQKCKQNQYGLLAIDARSTSGKLKVTKESFRRAMREIADSLRMKSVS